MRSQPAAAAAMGGEMASVTEGGTVDGPTGNYGSVEGPAASLGEAGQLPIHGLPKNKAEMQALAKLAMDVAKADLKAGIRDLPALLAPWALFCLCLAPVALMETMTLSYLSTALAGIVVIGFGLFSIGRAWKMLAFTCLVAAGLGLYLGFYDREKYLFPYYVYSRSPFHTDVLPSDLPDGYRDAGYIGFSQDSYVDASRGLGYRAGDLWCVAPIIGRQQLHAAGVQLNMQQSAGFWAVGKNCCQKRGTFQCGNSWSHAAHGGLAVFDVGRMDVPVIPTYKLAIAAAAQTYGLIMPEEPILIQWAEDPAVALAEIYGDAVNFVWLAAVVMLGIIPALGLTLSCFDLSLTCRESTEHWHPEEFQHMRFGVDFKPAEYSRELQLGLMHGRCYWSGEVIYDYMFHIANKHLYLGCLFCHPAHPLSKWERICIAMLVSLFIIFPVAAFSVNYGQTGLTRSFIILVCVTVPRNVLKLYLIQVVQQDTVLELEEGHHGEGGHTRKAFVWEVTFLFFCFLLCLATCAACSSYILAASSLGLGAALLQNTDGLAFAVVLEPLIDLAMPFVGLDAYDGAWTFGFFGRWRRERDHFAYAGTALDLPEDARKPAATAAVAAGADHLAEPAASAAAAAGAGGKMSRSDTARTTGGAFSRQLFRDAGTEILLAPEARASKQRNSKSGCGKLQKSACPAWYDTTSKPPSRQQASDPFMTRPSEQSFAH